MIDRLINILKEIRDQVIGGIINFWSARRVDIFIGIGIFFLGFIWGVVVA